MSSTCVTYVLENCPLLDPYELSVMISIADGADYSGCGSRKSQETIATEARCSDRKVRDVLAELQAAGVLAKGDQRLVSHVPRDKRPVVWDVLIPYSWFREVAKVNKKRVSDGMRPLTEESRPDILTREPKARRADLGKPKAKKRPATEAGTDTAAGLVVHPPITSGNSDVTDGLGVRPDYKSTAPGLQVHRPRTGTPTIFGFDPDGYDPVFLSGAAGAEDQKDEKSSEEQPQENPAATAVLDETLRRMAVRRHRQPTGSKRTELITLVSGLLDAGWSETSLVAELADGQRIRATDHVFGVLRYRITNTGRPATTVPAPEQRTIERCNQPGHFSQPASTCLICAGEAKGRADEPKSEQPMNEIGRKFLANRKAVA